MRPLLEDHPLLDGFIGLPTGGGSRAQYAGMGAVAEALRGERTGGGALVHLHPSNLCQLAGWRAKITERIGYQHSFLIDWTLTHRQEDRRQEGLWHEAQYNFDLLAPLGIHLPPPADLKPTVHLAAPWRESLRIKLAAAGVAKPGKYVVLNPTAHSLAHRWPPENFAWLAGELRAHCEQIVLVGEHVGDPSVQELRALVGGVASGVIDLVGRLNLAELGWLLRDAALLVSRNTGTTHLAAAVGCPVVELFGRMEPAYGPTRWRSLGASVVAISAPPIVPRRGETRRQFWRRSHASIPRQPTLEAALTFLRAD